MFSNVIIISAFAAAATLVTALLLLYYLHRRRAQRRWHTNSALQEEAVWRPPPPLFCCCCDGGTGSDGSTTPAAPPADAADVSRMHGAAEEEQLLLGDRATHRRTTAALAQQQRQQQQMDHGKPKYKVRKKLGEGAYGSVFLALRQPDMRAVAVKVVPCHDEKAAGEAMKEYEMCQASQGHENIVALYDVFYDFPVESSADVKLYGTSLSSESTTDLRDSKAVVKLKELGIRASGAQSFFCIVSEYCEAGTLFDLLLTKRAAGQRREVVLPEAVVWDYTVQLLRGIAHMHSKNLLHRDLKPSNVLLSNNFQRLTLTDFGLSRMVCADEYAQTRTGTMQYLSPEQVQRRYNHKSDVWAVGCLVYAMCTARVSNESARVMFRDVNKPSFVEETRADLQAYTPSLHKFMLSLLARSASDRPTATEALAVCESELLLARNAKGPA